MPRLLSLFPILTIPLLLAGCAGTAGAQTDEVKPTDIAVKAEPSATPEVVSQQPPAECPISIPPHPEFVPPSIPFVSPPSEPLPNSFWFGSEHLWTSLPMDGTWPSLPHNPEGYTQKIFWWSDHYSLKEQQPDLIVTGQRLDAKAPPLHASKATNASSGDIGESMLTGVDFPTLGCWKITGQYKDAELSFVVWVAP